MKILITGVYGIVGSYLCEHLRNNNEIVGIGRRKVFDGCNKYYSCDITEKEQIKKVFDENKDIDIIIHCAALAHNKGNDLSFDRFMKVNYEATKYLVDLSNEYLNLKNFIFISTISVYGENLEKSIYREIDICEPRSPYAVAKKKSEDYITEKCKSNYSILRLAPVYSEKFTLNIDRRSKIKNIPYRVGNGKPKLSLCNIANIYEAINYITNNYEDEKEEIYNISDNRVYEFNDLLAFNNVGVKKIIFPRIAFSILNKINKIAIKNQFLHENTIKLISDNIYSSDKINNKIKMKYCFKDVL
ncbi:NAD-dependent epimerase/dehydratase family protein [Clostridium perfringens]|uniref:NAD-dependent epimerase/dehydratase family protein n=1 Tax=Clostridium perfringens TaxID=1502 RepID=UPI001C84A4C1|nr:NAD(P)-dependent oxidoreductase [Clostridium perfringens]MDK0937060.1 NAD(P)-dependent oxidoreductase [Clostridium perfringens]